MNNRQRPPDERQRETKRSSNVLDLVDSRHKLIISTDTIFHMVGDLLRVDDAGNAARQAC